jgi:hypothetical protein
MASGRELSQRKALSGIIVCQILFSILIKIMAGVGVKFCRLGPPSITGYAPDIKNARRDRTEGSSIPAWCQTLMRTLPPWCLLAF